MDPSQVRKIVAELSNIALGLEFLTPCYNAHAPFELTEFEFNYWYFSGGVSGHYFVLSGGDRGRTLIWRWGHPGEYYCKSVGVYNPITIMAFVETDQNEALDNGAFQMLLEMVKNDLPSADQPKYLLR